MIAANGKVLIRGDIELAKRIQNDLFDRGYKFQNNPTELRPGEKIWGICFTTDSVVTTRNKKSHYIVYKMIRWTSKPEVFKLYPGPVVNEDFEPIKGIKPKMPVAMHI